MAEIRSEIIVPDRQKEDQAVHKMYSASPRWELREYVRAYGQREIDSSTPDIVLPCPASLEHIIELEFRNSPILEFDDSGIETPSEISAIGCQTHRRARVRFRGAIDSFAIFFQPVGLWQLFRVPLGVMVDHAYAGPDVFGSGIRQLRQRMAEKDFHERVLLAEEYLLPLAANALRRSAVMKSAIHLFQGNGETRIAELANGVSLGVRQFERRFLGEIGLSPKLFARITRYQMALDAKLRSPNRRWLNIAHEFGYHDQMHMIKDFENLSGDSPSALLLRIRGMRHALADASEEGRERLAEPRLSKG